MSHPTNARFTTRRQLLKWAVAATAVGAPAGTTTISADEPLPAASQPSAARETVPASPPTYLAGVIKVLKTQWPHNRTVNIVCHGHSVPAGYFKTPVVDTFNAYPHLLHRGLKERFPHAVINVIVTAIGGESSDSGAARFERDVLAHRPDVLTVDYALNDRRIGLEKAAAAWSSMIDKALTRGVKVILLAPTADTGADMNSPGDALVQHAAQVRELARRHNVALADSFAAFDGQLKAGVGLEELMSQSNHPNRKGHDLVAGALLEWFPWSAA